MDAGQRTVPTGPGAHGRSATTADRRGRARPARARPLGLIFTAAVVVLGGFALGPRGSLLVLGAPTTFAMPVLAAIADWNAGAHGRRAAAVDSLVIIGSAVCLTVLGQLVIGHVDPAGAVRTVPAGSADEMPTFPYEIPLGALAFVTFLQVSVVSEGRVVLPARYGPTAGRLAVAGCLAVAVAAYALLANWTSAPAGARPSSLWDPGGPFGALDIAAWLICVAIWQTAHGLLDGWPYTLIERRATRVLVANVAVVALGSVTYAVASGPLGVTGPRLSAAGAMFVVGASVVGSLPDGRPLSRARPAWRRAWAAAGATCVAAAAYLALHWLGLAAEQHWTPQAPVELWMVICGLNLIGGAVPWYTRVLRRRAG